jgi:hypothetical protein
MAGAALLFFSIAPAFSQDGPGYELGIYPSRTYHGTDIERVNMATNRVVVHIPLLEDHSQRGKLNFTYSLSLSSSGNWTYHQYNTYAVWTLPDPARNLSFITDGAPTGPFRDHYRYSDGLHTYDNYAWYIKESDGAKHPLGASGSSLCCTASAIDGSGWTYAIGGSGTPTVLNRDGLQFYSTSNSSPPLITNYFRDPNGNQMTSVWDLTTNITTLTDTLGRPWPMA